MTPLQQTNDATSLLGSSTGTTKDWIVGNKRLSTLADAETEAQALASKYLIDTPIYEKVSVALAPTLPSIQIVDTFIVLPPVSSASSPTVP